MPGQQAKPKNSKSKKQPDAPPGLTPKQKALLLSVAFDELGIDILWTVAQLKQLAQTPTFAPQVRLAAVKQLQRLRREALDTLKGYAPARAATTRRRDRRIGRKYPAA